MQVASPFGANPEPEPEPDPLCGAFDRSRWQMLSTTGSCYRYTGIRQATTSVNESVWLSGCNRHIDMVVVRGLEGRESARSCNRWVAAKGQTVKWGCPAWQKIHLSGYKREVRRKLTT